jgi:hypothetical protein
MEGLTERASLATWIVEDTVPRGAGGPVCYSWCWERLCTFKSSCRESESGKIENSGRNYWTGYPMARAGFSNPQLGQGSRQRAN